MFSRKAFVLAELVIVALILAILSAIAVPQFRDAQQRSKVSRAKADMRSLATALEAYRVNNSGYPGCNSFSTLFAETFASNPGPVLENLTTPIAYITNASFRDPFPVSYRLSAANAQGMGAAFPIGVSPGVDANATRNSYTYQCWNKLNRCVSGGSMPSDNRATGWEIQSCGPDRTYYNLGGVLANDTAAQLQYTINLIYDPTNGQVSGGSIFRTGGNPDYSGSNLFGEGLFVATQRGW